MTPGDRHAEARARAEAKYDFYKHLAVYFVVNLMLFLINLLTSPGYFWCIWPLIGWGIALALHALSIFVFDRGNVIVDRLTEQELRNGPRRP